VLGLLLSFPASECWADTSRKAYWPILAPYVAVVYACQAQWKRAVPVAEIAAAARQFTPNVQTFPSVPEAVRAALAEAGSGDMILITGSFYTVGDVPVEALEPWRRGA
jgi:dihydrofolate synthase / folylpolyglutamate synthase